jgi:uncharacterized protein YndB with AHSA1/START domain
VISVSEQVNATRRVVGTRVLEAGEARVVTISRVYAAAVDEVWDACTNPERIPRWFLPVSGDLRVGGRYQLEGNAGGVVERCDPPHSFAATWEFGGSVSWIELRLTGAGEGQTRFELDHLMPVDELDAHWTEFGPGAVGIGWDLALQAGLATHLATGKSVDPAAAAEWTASAEGREFITRCSDRWYEADVAGGADPDRARAAADRTTAAYTAPPAPPPDAPPAT